MDSTNYFKYKTEFLKQNIILLAISNRYLIMNELFLDFEKFVIQHRDLNLQITRYIYLFELKIKDLIESIRKSSYIESKEYFEILFSIQIQLAKAQYRYEYIFSEKITKFIYDFDRQDDVSIEYWFEKIKSQDYIF